MRPGVLWNGGPSPRTRQFSSVAGVMPISGAAVLVSISLCIALPIGGPTRNCGGFDRRETAQVITMSRTSGESATLDYFNNSALRT